MSEFIEERNTPDDYALYLDGDLQFDTRDERVYHEAMALPALSLAKPLDPELGLQVLICGGGDGLALRECLRFPGVARVDLVDYSPEVIALGKTRFATTNDAAFADSRVRVCVQDAREFLKTSGIYDVILLDFTVPRRPDETEIFTKEWYATVAGSLSPGGMACVNGLSPEKLPEAFWCLKKTIHAGGLNVLPYRVGVPSFRECGYGVWAFFLASHRPLTLNSLRLIDSPVETVQTDLSRLWRGARFSRKERDIEKRVGVHSLLKPCLLPLILNPSTAFSSGETALDSGGEPEPFALDPLLKNIPIQHPYHTRVMIETLANEVVGTVRGVDLQRLTDALLERASRLSDSVVKELRRLRDFLGSHLPSVEMFRLWSSRVLAMLIVLLTVANAISPDTAFAKGGEGIGHSSMSRGYSSAGRTSSGSFGGARSVGGSFGTSSGRAFGAFRPSSRMTSVGFRRGTVGRGQATDIYGNSYASRSFTYGHGYYVGYYGGYGGYGYGGGGYGGNGQSGATPDKNPQTHNAAFVADEDLLVMENGDVIVTLSDTAYLLINDGKMSLFHQKLPDPLLPLSPPPELIRNIIESLNEQTIAVQDEIELRKDWLSWVSWTSALLPTVRADKEELANLEALVKRLETAKQRIGKIPEPPAASLRPVPTGAIELFASTYLLPDGRYAIRRPDGLFFYTDGKSLSSEKPGEKASTPPPELLDALKSVNTKLIKELDADLKKDDGYLAELVTEYNALQKDMAEYQNYRSANGGSYEVDYGTDTMSADEAITKMEADIAQWGTEYNTALTERRKDANDLQTLNRQTNTTFVSPPEPLDPRPSSATSSQNGTGAFVPQ